MPVKKANHIGLRLRFVPYGILALLICFSGCKEEGKLIFHDTFEQYDAGTRPRGPWSISGKGIVKIDSTKSHSGKSSVYIEAAEDFDRRALMSLSGNPLFPFAYNRITGSFYVWLEDSPADGVHWTMIRAGGPVRGKSFSSELKYGGQYRKRLMADYSTKGVRSDCYKVSNAVIPEKEWVKIGWQFDGKNGTTKFWLNDQLIDELCTSGSGHACLYNDLEGQWFMPVFTELSIGWSNDQPGGGVQRLWIDDVKLYF